MTPTSVRLDDDMLQFLAGMDRRPDETNADLIRKLMAEARQMREGFGDYPAAMRLFGGFASRADAEIKVLEDAADQHSELVARAMNLMSDSFAFAISTAVSSEARPAEQLRKLEMGLAKRLMSMAEVLLQQAVSNYASTYDPTGLEQSMRGRMAGLAKLASIASDVTNGEERS
ncbi:hypothetical protein [Abyssibacter profundi]|uniref:Uncharacterized protein n=1 Tax=Abyssibacter profundi TaxID=2182787 RepID=A0A363UKY3_9GAMM|nr:hypothetical protein [Abyssibacter profundi]PWN56092.1 hypothetical protein DEH80_09795 [Abyssibacter profundi]